MATRVLQFTVIQATVLSIVVPSFQNHTYITKSSKLLEKIATDSFHHRQAVEFMVLRYLREIKDNSPFVHLIIESAGDDTYKSQETIVKTCSNFGIPVKLLLLDKHQDNFITQNLPRYPKLRYVFAVSRNLSSLQPEKWKDNYIKRWKSGTLFGVFIEKETLDVNSAKKMLKRFWALDCSNVVLIDLNSSSTSWSTMPKIYSYNPFSTIIERSNGTLYEVNSTETLFPDKLKNLKGHSIAISLFRHKPRANLTKKQGFASATGMDTELIRYASKKLNFTVNLFTEDVDAASYVTRLSNGKKAGPIGDILLKKTEYLGNSQFLDVVHPYNASVDYIYPFWRSYSVVVTRKASPYPAFFQLIRQADCCVFYSGIASLLIFFIYQKFIKKNKNFLLTILSLVLFQHLPKISSRNFDRIFCFSLICSSFFICTIYQGHLVHDLTAPPIYPNIDTLKDLSTQESLNLMVRPYELRILSSANHEFKRKLSKIARVELNFSDCVMRMKISKYVACSIDQSYGKYQIGEIRRARLMKSVENRYLSKYKNLPELHIVKESLAEFWQSYVVRKGFPYLEKMNDVMQRAIEFGLIIKWMRDDKAKRFHEIPGSKEPKPLSVMRLDYTFGILLIGHSFATVVFIFEIIVARGWLRKFWNKIYFSIRRMIG